MKRRLLLAALLGFPLGLAAYGAVVTYSRTAAATRVMQQALQDRLMLLLSAAWLVFIGAAGAYLLWSFLAYRRAVEDQDPTLLRKVANRRGPKLRRAGGSSAVWADVFEANALLAEERFAEAERLLGSLDLSGVAPRSRELLQAMIDNDLAWAVVHSGGDATRAIAAAGRAVEVGRRRHRPLQAAALGTLGAGLLANGDAPGARAALREALALRTSRVARSSLLLFLGEAELALGDFAAASRAFHEAVRSAPRSRWAERASAHLAALEQTSRAG